MYLAVAAMWCLQEGDRENVSIVAAFAAFVDVVCEADALISLRRLS
jgi:hypothetical protein